MELELIKWMIRRDYKIKYYLDKLPAGYNLYPLKDKNNNPEIHYTSGVPLGYYVTNAVGSETFYIYNHLTFNVKVHYEKNLDKYTIVGFDIIPISINHQIAGYMVNEGVIVDKGLGKQQEKESQRDKESAIKDLNKEGKGNNDNLSTQESKARSDDGRRRLDGEDFLKSDKAENNTDTKKPIEDFKETEKNLDKDKNSADTKENKDEGDKKVLFSDKPKNESEKLCKFNL